MMVRAVSRARNTQALMTAFVTPFKKLRGTSTASMDFNRRLAVFLFAASRLLAIDLLGCAEFKAFADCAGGTIDKSKGKYVKLLPAVYKTVAHMSADETGEAMLLHAATMFDIN